MVARLALALVLLSGCTVTYKDMGFSAFQLAPGDEIQTTSMTVVGLALMPSEASIFLGYVRTQSNRIPTFDKDTLVPDVAISTSVSPSGPFVVETLSVGQLTTEPEVKRTLLQRLLPGGK